MQRQGFKLPLLIGGAPPRRPTPRCASIRSSGPVVYVKDASRSVGVCQQLVSPRPARPTPRASSRNMCCGAATRRASHQVAAVHTAAGARQPTRIDWPAYQPPVRACSRAQLRALFDRGAGALHRLDTILQRWELRGKFPDILTDAQFGEQASSLYADARKMLRTVIREQWLQARAVIGFFAANAVDDDVELYADEAREQLLARVHFLRQQKDLPEGKRTAHCRISSPQG